MRGGHMTRLLHPRGNVLDLLLPNGAPGEAKLIVEP